MNALGAAAERDGACYFTGGATAVLLGWREATIDIDIALDPEQDAALRALPSIAPTRLRESFEEIEPALYRFPAIDPRSFRRRVEKALAVTQGLVPGQMPKV